LHCSIQGGYLEVQAHSYKKTQFVNNALGSLSDISVPLRFAVKA
jgi:hypothetical protein